MEFLQFCVTKGRVDVKYLGKFMLCNLWMFPKSFYCIILESFLPKLVRAFALLNFKRKFVEKALKKFHKSSSKSSLKDLLWKLLRSSSKSSWNAPQKASPKNLWKHSENRYQEKASLENLPSELKNKSRQINNFSKDFHFAELIDIKFIG